MWPKPKRATHFASVAEPSFPAIVTAPTFDECDRISATDRVWVALSSASWTEHWAHDPYWSRYGSVKRVVGFTIPSESAAVTVTSLKVEPGS